MPSSTTSVFGEPDDYQAALQTDGAVDLIVTARGEFRAQLMQIVLPHMHLVAGVENRARIAFISPPARVVRISLPVRGGGLLFSGGIASRSDEIVTHGPGQRLHERTDGPCHWRSIWLPAQGLNRYGRAMVGATFEVPSPFSRWRPVRSALRQLIRLYDDAIRVNKVQPYVVAGAEAARGLDWELIDALIECVRGKPTEEGAAANFRRLDVMARFEDRLRARPDRTPPIADICRSLHVSDRTLRAYCKAFLGMGPHRYRHLRQMQLAHRALQGADPDARLVSDVARQFGFDGLGRFAASYREQFGELPSTTVRRRTTQ
jgi:AraC-like DNA-binding protein